MVYVDSLKGICDGHIHCYSIFSFFRSAMQLRLEPHVCSSVPQAVAYFKSRDRKPNCKKRKMSLWNVAANLHLLLGTGWNGQGGTHPSKKRRKHYLKKLKRFVGVKKKQTTMTEWSGAKILIPSVPRETAGFVTTSLTVRREIAMNGKE